MQPDIPSLTPSGDGSHRHGWINTIAAFVVTLMLQGFGYLLSLSNAVVAAAPKVDPAWVTAVGGIVAAFIYVIGGRLNSHDAAENRKLRKMLRVLRSQIKEMGGLPHSSQSTDPGPDTTH